MAASMIQIRGLGKRYDLGETLASGQLRERLSHGLRRLIGRGPSNLKQDQSFWALRDVSFDVPQGEVMGVIGRNGAGKSTLLKILSRITEPTEGEVEMRGRVASLLEVGTGFHKELTGRENVFLNGAILGMSRAEIRRKFDEIVEFAGLQRFIDTPVKRYSSGMTVRLAFAVAAHLEPEILIIDEVLAVGDFEFQARCLGKIGEVARSGRTILFVSHDLAAVERLCTQVVLLASGQVQAIGPSSDVVRSYLHRDSAAELGMQCPPAPEKDAQVLAVRFEDHDGKPVQTVTTSTALAIAVKIQVRRQRKGLRLAIALNDEWGRALFSTNPSDAGCVHPTQVGTHLYRLELPPQLLMHRGYHLTFALYDASGTVEHLQDAIRFEVERDNSSLLASDSQRVGLLQVACHWHHELACAELVKDAHLDQLPA